MTHNDLDQAAPGGATVSGDFVSLHPGDGLFLRAEHLQAIQTYARELSQAVGIGTGTGAVYGFDVTLDHAKSKPLLHVGPGLAINAVGQPLRSTTGAVVSLATDDLPPIDRANGFWVIEVNHASWHFGNENVYGNPCDEPCNESGAALQPWTAEGVTISLRADELPGLSVGDPVRRRSLLASQYFERERRQGGPWLVPGSGSNVVGIESHDWTRGAGQPVPSGVPIGVVQHVDGEWMVDVWTARRDIGGPPADDAWRARLAMRPWNVFLAQVLQFQDQLSLLGTEREIVEREVVDFGRKVIDKAIAELAEGSMGKRRDFKAFQKTLLSAPAAYVLASAGKSLWQRGFDELPPAGYLARTGTGLSMQAWLEPLFGDHVDLRICNVRADYVAGAVEEAQHLDRIPLDPSSPYPKATVDVLVPTELTDVKGLHTDHYPWVAFVRRREPHCVTKEARPDRVDVYVFEGEVGQVADGPAQQKVLTDANRVGQLSYPAGSWEYPGREEVALGAIKRLPTLNADPNITIVAIASGNQRQPLAALRGSLFGASLDNQIPPPRVLAITLPAVKPEAIVVVFPQER